MIHILTGEYPPVRGGVADYTALVAKGLADRGESVQVWTGGDESTDTEGSIRVHRIAQGFGRAGLRALDRAWNEPAGPRRVIVQWTPHSFGMRSLNLPLAYWLRTRARRHQDQIELMVHEPFLAFGEGTWKQDAAAAVQRVMMALLLDAAWRVRVAIPAWEARLRPWCLTRQHAFEWAPVPSNIPEYPDLREVLRARAAIGGPAQMVVGHFGTFRRDVACLLFPVLEELLRTTDARVLLAGRGSDEFADTFTSRNSDFDRRISSFGELEAEEVAIVLSACDVLLQPYPDGISTRRGTAMAALALGIPMVSNLGHLSEPKWRDTEAARIMNSASAQELTAAVRAVLQDRNLRAGLSANARSTYQAQFALSHTIDSLLRDDAQAVPETRAA
ncbi:glycosyltransferase family 4 protein [Nevskia soli]|uniref:glycosyltransferase family 4 protein n=1 Tax=Nevskia soli TaxID=418856 RepID=UPI0015D90691|nr:glycosyltransferase family 4 protein [Nevskia soli]